MTSLVLGIVGAVVGFYVGGPTGAQIGFALGSAVGGAIDTANTKIRNVGPRLSDLKVTVSSLGNFVPYVWGTMRISGNIVESTDYIPSEHKTSSGGKGGPKVENTTTTYSVTFMVLLCRSKGTHTIRRIWAGGRLIASFGGGASAATLLANNEQAGNFNIYRGASTQLPDATLEALYGIGNVSAYRGYLTCFFKHFELADYSNNLAATQLTFEVVEYPSAGPQLKELDSLIAPSGIQILTSMVGNLIYMWMVVTTAADARVYRDDGNGMKLFSYFRLTHLPDEEIYEISPGRPEHYNPPVPAVPPLCGLRPFLRPDRATYFDGVCISDGEPLAWRFNVPIRGFVAVGCLGGPGYASSVNIYDPAGQLVRAVDIESWLLPALAIEGEFTYINVCCVDPQAQAIFVHSLERDPLSQPHTLQMTVSTESNLHLRFDGELFCGINAANGLFYLLTKYPELASSLGWRLKLRVIDETTGHEQFVFAGPDCGPGSANRYKIFFWDNKVVVTLGVGYVFEWDDAGTLSVIYDDPLRLASDLPGGGGEVLSWRGKDFQVITCYVVSNPVTQAFERSTWLFAPKADPASDPTLIRILTELCAEKGIYNIGFRNIGADDVVHGFVLTRLATARAGIEYLCSAYRVDQVESQGVLTFVKRGGAPVRTLKLSELGARKFGAGAVEPLQVQRQDELSLPKLTTVNFSDIDNAYQAGAALSPQRLNTTSDQTANLDVTALALHGSEAAMLADVSQMEAWVNRTSYKFSTTLEHEDLEPTDVVLVDEAA